MMIYILFSFYAHVHGETNAFLYSRKGADAIPANEHKRLVIERCLAAALALSAIVYPLLFTEGAGAISIIVIGELIASALAFSFWHNRGYYLMRDRIDGTSHGAGHTSTTSTAKNTFTLKQRKTMLLASIGVIALTFLIYFIFYI